MAGRPQKHQPKGSRVGEGSGGVGVRDAGEVELGVTASGVEGDWRESGQSGLGNQGHGMVNGGVGVELGGAAVQGSSSYSIAGTAGGIRDGGAGRGAGRQGWGYSAGGKSDGLQGHCASGGTLELQSQCAGGEAAEQQAAPVSKTAAFLRFTLGLGNDGVPPAALHAWSSGSGSGEGGSDRTAMAQGWGKGGGDELGRTRTIDRWGGVGRLLRGLAMSSGRAGEDEDKTRAQEQEGGQGLLEGAGQGVGGLGLAPRARSKKGGRSTLVLCVAGMACNMVASLAWGMLLSWARDLLLIPGTCTCVCV
eukprot:203360-Pelagomonas_calceolata.AAC.3